MKINQLYQDKPIMFCLRMLGEVNFIVWLIDQAYQFNRLYVKRTNQQKMLITIKYSEMVAEIYLHFQHDKLPNFGKKNL